MGVMVYLGLVVTRFVVCFHSYQSSGYIHPDQYFQIPEPLAGDILGLDHFRTWDWNATAPGPIRNVFFPYATAGVAFQALKGMTEHGMATINSYTLQAFPRIAMAASSLLVDLGIYIIARTLNFNVWNCLTVLASSYITLVFNTRTFSNVNECGLFSLLLALVVVSRHDQLKPVEISKENAEGKKKKSSKKCNETKKMPLWIKPPSDALIGFWIGIIIVQGTFARPTFPAFFILPLTFWIKGKETSFGRKAFTDLVRNVFCIIPSAVLMLIACVGMDSVYYGTLNSEVLDNPYLLLESLNFDLVKNLTLTPLNFVKYNINNANLLQHGIHPRITHFIVNFPMLYLPLFIYLLMEFLQTYKAHKENRSAGFLTSTSRVFFQLTLLTPIMLLSLSPHQEPRYILPIIVPLVLLYSDFIMISGSAFPNALWILFNLFGCIIFGHLHQGGLVNSIDYLRGMASHPAGGNPISYHFVFFHTYMPPHHLFYLQDKVFPPHANLSDDKFKHIMDKNEHIVTVHDLMGARDFEMHRAVEDLVSNNRTPTPQPYGIEIFLISPSSLDPIFCHTNVKYNFKLKAKFGHHLSMDDPPEWFPSYTCVSEPERSYNRMGFMEKLDSMFSLFVYQVEIKQL